METINWQERAEKAEESLRSLASFVGAGGYNADKVDADVFEQKIRWGIGQITERLEKAEAELARMREQKPIGYLSAECMPSASYGFFVKVEKWETQTNIPVYAAPVPAMPAPAERRHYPEEWGPSDNRKLTCSCGNELPCPDAMPAPAVPDGWREALAELARQVRGSGCLCGPIVCEYDKGSCCRTALMDALAAADALLQSSPQSGSEPVAHHPV